MDQPTAARDDHELSILPAPTRPAPQAPSQPEIHPEVQPEVQPIESSLSNKTPKKTKIKTLISLTALFSALFISALNTTLLATALPTITRELHSASGFAWIGGAYFLGNTSAAPIWAKLSDIWGRKPILLAAVAGFFCSSIVCASAVNMSMLIAGRALQGVAAGGLGSLVLIVISDTFSMRHRSLYLGLTELLWTVAGGVGPVMGGALAQHVSWRWNFWVMLPVSGVAFLLLLFCLDVHDPKTKMVDGLKAVDWAGSVTILGLLIMLLLGLNFGGAEFAWDSPTVICLIVFGLFMSVFFFISEKKLARHPLVPLEIFSHKSNIAVLLIGFANAWVLITGDYYYPFFFQSAKGASPVLSGVMVLPFNTSISLSGLLSGIYISKTGRYLDLIWVGGIIMTLGSGLYIKVNATTPIAQVFGIQILGGCGIGSLFSPPLIALQSLLSQQHTATSTSTLGLLRSLATVLGVVLGQVVFQNGMNHQAADLAAAGLSSNVTQLLTGDKAAANADVDNLVNDPLQRLVIKQAFASSLKNVWTLSTAISACGIVASLFVSKQILSAEHVETVTGIEKKEQNPEVTPAQQT